MYSAIHVSSVRINTTSVVYVKILQHESCLYFMYICTIKLQCIPVYCSVQNYSTIVVPTVCFVVVYKDFTLCKLFVCSFYNYANAIVFYSYIGISAGEYEYSYTGISAQIRMVHPVISRLGESRIYFSVLHWNLKLYYSILYP